MSKDNTAYVIAFVALVLLALVLVSQTVNARQVRPPCLYEVIAMGDSLVIGWLYDGCDPRVDLRDPEHHNEINHSVARSPCKVFGVWVWPNVTSPVVDTLPPWCQTASETDEGGVYGH
jgi:hypothetical protein